MIDFNPCIEGIWIRGGFFPILTEEFNITAAMCIDVCLYQNLHDSFLWRSIFILLCRIVLCLYAVNFSDACCPWLTVDIVNLNYGGIDVWCLFFIIFFTVIFVIFLAIKIPSCRFPFVLSLI